MNRHTTLTKQKLLDIKKLLRKKGRDESGKFIVEGWKSVEEAIVAGMKIDSVIYDAAKIDDPKLLRKIEGSAGEIYIGKTKELESLSDTVSTQGVIAVLQMFDHEESVKKILQKNETVIVVLDKINDPGNLGTIIRTCDWFGVDALVMSVDSVELYNPKVVRASMGSLFHLPILSDIDLQSFLLQCRQTDISIYSSEISKSKDIRDIRFAKKSVILIGNESHGVSMEISSMAEDKIQIPRFGRAESLNAAMACGIILAKMKL